MQFLWSALLAHVSHNHCAAAADLGKQRKQLSAVSSLAALTSGESLCGAPTELFEVPVSVVGRGMLVDICGAFYDALRLRQGSEQMRC